MMVMVMIIMVVVIMVIVVASTNFRHKDVREPSSKSGLKGIHYGEVGRCGKSFYVDVTP